MLNSKLPMETLGKIWDLSDMDKDGSLDRVEFSIVSICCCFFVLNKSIILFLFFFTLKIGAIEMQLCTLLFFFLLKWESI